MAFAPLEGAISVSFVTLNTVEGWVTAPRVVLRGRRQMNIFNNSSDYEIQLSGVSPSSVYRTLYPRQDVDFIISSDLHIFMRSLEGTVAVEITEIK
jgi:hypothetical protein